MHEAHGYEGAIEDELPPIEDDELLDGPGAHAVHAGNGTAGANGVGGDPDEFGETGLGSDSAEPGEVRMAGGVLLVRAMDTGHRLAVLESDGWLSLPKAEAMPGESAEHAAQRAAEAFTGLRVQLAESVGETEDWIGDDLLRSWMWLARPARGPVSRAPRAGAEGFQLHWLDLEEAEGMLGSEGERDLVARLRRIPLPGRRIPSLSADRRSMAHDLEAFRDSSAALARRTGDPEHLDAFLRARDEIERAEERLARGDRAGARRARARAERETLLSLDADGRALAMRRALERAPEHLAPILSSVAPAPGAPVSHEVLLAVHSAVEAEAEESAREQDLRGGAQAQAAIALGAATLFALVASATGLLGSAADAPAVDPWVLAVAFVVAGALGGWVGEALYGLRQNARASSLALPLATAAGGLAGFVLGAVLSGGLVPLGAGGSPLVIAATFAAGWLARAIVPRQG